MFFKVGVLKNFETYLKRFATFTEKNLCWSLFLIKLQAFRLAALLKRAYNTSCFHVNIAKLLRNAFLQNISCGCLEATVQGCRYKFAIFEKVGIILNTLLNFSDISRTFIFQNTFEQLLLSFSKATKIAGNDDKLKTDNISKFLMATA